MGEKRDDERYLFHPDTKESEVFREKLIEMVEEKRKNLEASKK